MLLLSMFYWNMNDSRDLDNFDHPSSFLTNSAFLLEFVFRLAFGSNLPKRMNIWEMVSINSWCELFAFPLAQLFTLSRKSWFINKIVVCHLVFDQVKVSRIFCKQHEPTTSHSLCTYSSNRKLNSSFVKS